MAFVTKLTLGFLTFSNIVKQKVVIRGEHSTWTPVISGVPQCRVGIIADIRLLLCLNIVSCAHINMQFVIFTS